MKAQATTDQPLLLNLSCTGCGHDTADRTHKLFAGGGCSKCACSNVVVEGTDEGGWPIEVLVSE